MNLIVALQKFAAKSPESLAICIVITYHMMHRRKCLTSNLLEIIIKSVLDLKQSLKQSRIRLTSYILDILMLPLGVILTHI